MDSDFDYHQDVDKLASFMNEVLLGMADALKTKRTIGVGSGLLSEYEKALTDEIVELKRQHEKETDEEKREAIQNQIADSSNLLREVKECRNDIRQKSCDDPLTRKRMHSCLEDCYNKYKNQDEFQYKGLLQNSDRLNHVTMLYLGLEHDQIIDEGAAEEIPKEQDLTPAIDNSLTGEILPPTGTDLVKWNDFNDREVEIIYNAQHCLEQSQTRLIEDNRMTNTKGHLEITPLLSGPSQLALAGSDYDQNLMQLNQLLHVAQEKHQKKLLTYPYPSIEERTKEYDLENGITREIQVERIERKSSLNGMQTIKDFFSRTVVGASIAKDMLQGKDINPDKFEKFVATLSEKDQKKVKELLEDDGGVKFSNKEAIQKQFKSGNVVDTSKGKSQTDALDGGRSMF